MIEIGIGLFVSAFIAGNLMFLAPCTLPLVPAYLGIISGVSAADLRDPQEFGRHRWRVVTNGFFYVIGFSLVFIVFGTAIGLLGGLISGVQFWLRVIGGMLVILFGLYLLGIFRLDALAREWSFSQRGALQRGGKWGSFLMGSIFASGWSPCVGPVLGTVLLIAGTQGSAVAGAALLTTFSAGLAIPFLLVALFVSRFFRVLERAERAIRALNIVAGIFLIAVGLLLLTDNFTLLIAWGYRAFNFLEYDRLLEFL